MRKNDRIKLMNKMADAADLVASRCALKKGFPILTCGDLKGSDDTMLGGPTDELARVDREAVCKIENKPERYGCALGMVARELPPKVRKRIYADNPDAESFLRSALDSGAGDPLVEDRLESAFYAASEIVNNNDTTYVSFRNRAKAVVAPLRRLAKALRKAAKDYAKDQPQA